MTETRIPSGGKIPPFFTPIDVLEIGQPGMPGELIIHNGKLYVYGPTGATLIDGGIIQADAILADSITAEKIKFGVQKFTHNIVWTATDYNRCSWSAGTIKISNGEEYEINTGNTGNITDITFVYFDGTSTLKTTTTYSNAVGDEKLLLAIVEPSESGAGCIIIVINSSGTTIDGDKIVTGKIQSIDTRTYFDLNENKIVMHDGTTNRVAIGDI